MAKKNAQPKVPLQPAKDSFGAQIFSMPERYQHGAEAKMVVPEKPKKKPVQVVAPKPPPMPLPPKPPAIKKPKKKGGRLKIILALLGVSVIIILVVGWFVYQYAQKEVVIETPEKEVVTSRPAPQDLEPKEEEKEVEEPEVEVDPFAVDVQPGIDSDSDGLSDTEEKLVYKTDPRLPDSDSDGFLDGNEVYHRYNPNGTSSGTLEGSGLALVYSGDAEGVAYTILYPSVWDLEETDEGLVIDAETGEGFRITSMDKELTEEIQLWVDQNVGLDDVIEDTTKNGLEMVQSENQLWAYVDLGEAVLVVEYDTGIKTRIDYLQTFKMMLNRIEL